MALATFTPVIDPSPGTSVSQEIALNKASFGDGYTQAGPQGLNHVRQTVELRWDALTRAQMDALKSFFEGRQGYKPFYYQPPSFAGVLKWTCEKWTSVSGVPCTFQATLIQSFTNQA